MAGLFSTIGSFFGPWGTAIGAGVDAFAANKEEDSARNQQRSINQENYAAQKEFAQKGIQWKAADAAAAGLHPLAVIGGTGTSFSPSYQLGQSVSDRAGDSLAASISGMGQNTARAERAGLTEYEREVQALALRRGQLENALLEGQISKLWASVMGQPDQPAVPGQPVATGSAARHLVGSVDYQASPQESYRSGDRGSSAGESPGFRTQHVSNQTAVDLPNTELAEVLEGMGVAGHVVGPLLMARRDYDKRVYGRDKPSDKLLPKNMKWEWSIKSQSWRAVPRSKAVSNWTPDYGNSSHGVMP